MITSKRRIGASDRHARCEQAHFEFSKAFGIGSIDVSDQCIDSDSAPDGAHQGLLNAPMCEAEDNDLNNALSAIDRIEQYRCTSARLNKQLQNKTSSKTLALLLHVQQQHADEESVSITCLDKSSA